jgi:hypothetical protein
LSVMPFNSLKSEGSPSSTPSATPDTVPFGGLPVHPVSMKEGEGDVVTGARLGVVFSDGGLDRPNADLFGSGGLGSHGMCRKKQVNRTCRASQCGGHRISNFVKPFPHFYHGWLR